MAEFFEGTCGMEEPEEIYETIHKNCPDPPRSNSDELWKLRRKCDISPASPRRETMLEKAVANLGESCHMPWWFNQCPVASGIVRSSRNKRNAVDLVHWSESTGHARLIELKWASDNPRLALQEILRYGVAYIFCRVHRKELPLDGRYFRPIMDAHTIGLEVVAPRKFYRGDSESDRFAKVSRSINDFARSKTDEGLSMSLKALSFPEEFSRIPFKCGKEVLERCFTRELTREGQIVRDAFKGLVPAWPPRARRGE